MSRPLEGLLVLEFAQYMAGPWAGLRLADMGATVIKVERPGKGEAGRSLATKNMYVDGDSLVAHTVNRNKGSFAADLKDPDDLAEVKKLIARADVMTHNFRPGVMERIGLDYEAARELNPRLIYATVTGYGTEGPWRDKPGQDLLAQSLSGLPCLTGRADDPPVPLGLAVADGICGHHLAQGILAALVRRGRTGEGARVEVSLLESILDLQFEGLTTYLNDGGRRPQRSAETRRPPLAGRALRHLPPPPTATWPWPWVASPIWVRYWAWTSSRATTAPVTPSTTATRSAVSSRCIWRPRPRGTGWSAWSRPASGARRC